MADDGVATAIFPNEWKALWKKQRQLLRIITSSALGKLKKKTSNTYTFRENCEKNTCTNSLTSCDFLKQPVNGWIHLWLAKADRIAINDAQRTIEVNGKMGGKSEKNGAVGHGWKSIEVFLYVEMLKWVICSPLHLHHCHHVAIAGIAREATSFRSTTARATQWPSNCNEGAQAEISTSASFINQLSNI